MSTTTVRLTMAQALVRFLTAQKVDIDGQIHPLFGGVWAIFGHGNVAGLGEALYPVRNTFPTYRAHNEQAMAHAAIAFAKTHSRRRMMACTTSIGPGATNMVTAAALAHVNRLPVLFLPGDTFANRVPDPVLQQLEAFTDPTISANDCFRPVSRYFDRIERPEQLIGSLSAAIEVLTDPQLCGPVTLALPQDVQAEAYDYPQWLFEERVHRLRRFAPDDGELQQAVQLMRKAKKPLLIAGGGVHYSDAGKELDSFCTAHGIPVCETQAGKGALVWDHPCQVGAVGVTGSSAANQLAAEADLVIAVGTRFQDFTTGSRTLFSNPGVPLVSLNVNPFDAVKHRAVPLRCDALVGLQRLSAELGDWHSAVEWRDKITTEVAAWNQAVEQVTAATDSEYPSDA
ncbi:MAG: thiamine pyrophosphate-binding protein, partial [Chromatiales bacterium]